PRAQEGRGAAKHRLDREPALDGEIGGSRTRKHDAHRIALRKPYAAERRDRLRSPARTPDFKARGRARKRDTHTLRRDLERRALIERLERRGPVRVADDEIGSAQRHRIERAGNRNARPLMTDPAKVLNGRAKARDGDAQSGHQARPCCGESSSAPSAAARSSASKRARSTGLNRTSSPGSSSAQAARRGSN